MDQAGKIDTMCLESSTRGFATDTSSAIPPSSENFEPEIEEENNGAFYHRGAKAEGVAEYMYKIRDDSVRPRQFLGTDTEDGIEAILSERQGHSLTQIH